MAKETFEGWIARDEDGTLEIYDKKPTRQKALYSFQSSYWFGNGNNYGFLLDSFFPDQKWEDEPRKVKITIETE